ncbi:hypothetical protein VH22019_00106 [Vibrio phage VH2_2019]|nr:hypothetical protein VH22019_00106 [Vibrio phage VH2_2019]
MHPKDKEYYFSAGLLDRSNTVHVQMLDMWQKVLTWSQIPEEYIYRYRILDFLPEESKICEALRVYPVKKREGRYGYVIDRPTDTLTNKINFAIAGTFIRAGIDARVRTCRQALSEFADLGRFMGDVLILTDIEHYDEKMLKYGAPRLWDLLNHLMLKGKFVIVITHDFAESKGYFPDGVQDFITAEYIFVRGSK